MRYGTRHKQQGIALVVVMLVVAIVVVIAASMTSRLQLVMNRSINQQMVQQGLWSGLGGERLIYKVLKQDYKDDPNSVNLSQLWAREGMVFPVGDGMLSGEVRDLHSCFNLNVLGASNKQSQQTSSLAQRQLQTLFIEVGIDNYEAEQLASTIKDWIDSDSQMSGSLGAEDDMYSSKVVPYLAPNSAMVNLSELMAVEGMTPATYRKILPYVCVLPEATLRLNVNTIKPDNAAILVAAFEGKLSLDDAKNVLESRDEEGFKDINDFLSSSELAPLGKLDPEIKKQFQLTSNDFSALLTYSAQQQEFSVETVFQRDKKGKLAVTSRQFGIKK